MKRLGVFLVIALLVAGFGTTISRANAQTETPATNPQIPSGGTYDYFQSQVTQYYTKALAAEDAALAKSLALYQNNQTRQDVATNEATTYKKAIQMEYDAYLQAFNASQSSGDSPAVAQQKGIIAFTKTITVAEQTLKLYTLPRSSYQTTPYKTYTTDVQASLYNQATQINNGTISAGSIEAAVQSNPDRVAQSVTKSDSCSFGPSGNLLGCIDQLFTEFIKVTILNIAGFTLWLTANILNYVVRIGILGFSQWASDSLYPIWIIVRQIISLFVVFAGLWLGFMYIIGKQETFGKYIAWVILFGLFVNFSYPFSRALVDVSNVISLNVYTAAVGPQPLSGEGPNTAGAMIMNRLGLQELMFSATQVQGGASANMVKAINSTPAALLAVIFTFYAAYIFAYAAMILTARLAALVFLIITSPLLLVDSVVPQLGEVAVKMRKIFFEQLAVAPVFMIMLALTLQFLTVFQKVEQSMPGAMTGSAISGINSAATSDTGAAAVFFNILLMLVMLHIMLKVTKSVSGKVGEMASNTIGKVGSFATTAGIAVATGGTGLIARNTIGAAAARFRDSEWMDKKKDSTFGRGLYTLSHSLAQSSYDVRNSKIAKGSSGFLKKYGVDMGKGSERTYDSDFKAKEKKITEFARGIKNDETREKYLDNMANGVGSRVQHSTLWALTGAGALQKKDRKSDKQKIVDEFQRSDQKKVDRYFRYTTDQDRINYYEDQEDDIKKKIDAEKARRTANNQASNQGGGQPATNGQPAQAGGASAQVGPVAGQNQQQAGQGTPASPLKPDVNYDIPAYQRKGIAIEGTTPPVDKEASLAHSRPFQEGVDYDRPTQTRNAEAAAGLPPTSRPAEHQEPQASPLRSDVNYDVPAYLRKQQNNPEAPAPTPEASATQQPAPVATPTVAPAQPAPQPVTITNNVGPTNINVTNTTPPGSAGETIPQVTTYIPGGPTTTYTMNNTTYTPDQVRGSFASFIRNRQQKPRSDGDEAATSTIEKQPENPRPTKGSNESVQPETEPVA